jgi:hypothetical protein
MRRRGRAVKMVLQASTWIAHACLDVWFYVLSQTIDTIVLT